MLYRLYVHVIYTKNAFGAKMKRNAGFTLIELVIVIIVLGILAATAVPKFINLQDDAKEAAMTGVEAAVHSAANIVYSKSAIDGTETDDTTDTPKVGDIEISYGYPIASANGVELAVELSGFEAKFPISGTPNTIVFVSENDSAKTDLCLLYSEASSSAIYTLKKGKVNAGATNCDITGTNGDW